MASTYVPPDDPTNPLDPRYQLPRRTPANPNGPDVPPLGGGISMPGPIVNQGTGVSAPGPMTNVYDPAGGPADPTPTTTPTNPQAGQPGTPGPNTPAPTNAPAPTTNARPAQIDVQNQWLDWVGNSQYSNKQKTAIGYGGAAQYRNNLGPVVDAFNQAHPGSQAHAVGDDKIDFGDGRGPIDVLSGNGDWWFQGDEVWNQQHPNGEPGGGGGGNGGPASMPGPMMDDPNRSKWDELYNQLLQRSQQGLAIDRNDPIIRAQADAFAANQDRQKRNMLGDLAEKAGPYASGQLQGQDRMLTEKAGQATGGFEAGLMGDELKTRRDEIAQALQSRQSMLTFEQQQALQEKLAQLNAAIQREQMSQQNSQFLSQLGFNTADRSSYWDAIRSGLLN